MKIALLLIVLALVAGSGAELYYRDRVYPRVSVYPAGVDVGSQTRESAALRLRAFGRRQQFRVIALHAGDGAPVLVQAYKLGYRVDEGLSAWRAYHVARSGSLLDRLMAQARTLARGAEAPLAQWVDQIALRNYLFSLAPALNRRPIAGRAGRLLDVARAQRRIARLLLNTSAFSLQLPFTTVRTLPAVPASPRKRHPSYHTRLATSRPVVSG